jgi:hypothetical protein
VYVAARNASTKKTRAIFNLFKKTGSLQSEPASYEVNNTNSGVLRV